MADRVSWSNNQRAEFTTFMQSEIDRVISQRSNLEKQWREWLELFRAPQDKGMAHYPFEGASNTTFPFAKMTIIPIMARFMANIHATDNLWTFKALNEQWIDKAKPLQDYMQWLDANILDMQDVNERVFLEVLKLGTGIYKTGWLFERRRVMGYDNNKRRTRQIKTINRPFVDHVHLENFLIPPEASAIDPDAQGGAHWVAERHRMRPTQMRAMAKGQEPFLPNFDSAAVKIAIEFEEQKPTDREEKVLELDQQSTGLTLMEGRPVEVYEIHARYDTTGNGIEDDIVVVFHPPSQQILRATYEPLPSRPYTAVHYMRGDGFYGIGICEDSEVWQELMSDMTNFTKDKILLSNTPMIAVAEGANIVPDEPIFPGKQWHLADPSKDINPFHLIAPGNFELQQFTNFLFESGKSTVGVTDLQFGQVGALPSRTPATTIQSLLAEGNTRFDMSLKAVRKALSEVGVKILQNLQQQVADNANNPDATLYLGLAADVLGQPEGPAVVAGLTELTQAVELGIGVQLTATSGVNNKELQKQSNLALLQLLTQLGPGFLQLAQVAMQAQGTPLGHVATQSFEGLRQLVVRTLEQFDVRNAEELVPTLSPQMGAMAPMAQGQPFGPLAVPAGAGAAQGANGAPGLAGF